MNRWSRCLVWIALGLTACGGSQAPPADAHGEPASRAGSSANLQADIGPGNMAPRAISPPDNASRQVDKCRYSPECYIKGRCATPADPRARGCEAHQDDDCVHSQECAAWGRCAARSGGCFPSEDGCAKSLSCWQNGLCSLAPNGNACITTSDDQCRHSELCETAAQCSFAESRCVLGGRGDCVASGLCKKLGKCEMIRGECRPAKDDDCAQSDLCKSEHACKELNFQCIDERHEH